MEFIVQHVHLQQLAGIRIAVGYLGEKQQYGWWPSAFFANASASFAAPLFPRTQFLAQSVGVVAAAAQVHDERIGVGNVYHLFRLPEDLEQALHRLLHDSDAISRLMLIVSAPDVALGALGDLVASADRSNVGPTRIGGLTELHEIEGWRRAAAVYIEAFDNNAPAFPYFSGRQ